MTLDSTGRNTILPLTGLRRYAERKVPVTREYWKVTGVREGCGTPGMCSGSPLFTCFPMRPVYISLVVLETSWR